MASRALLVQVLSALKDAESVVAYRGYRETGAKVGSAIRAVEAELSKECPCSAEVPKPQKAYRLPPRPMRSMGEMSSEYLERLISFYDNQFGLSNDPTLHR